MQDNATEKQVASKEAMRIKEQMLGFVNGIIARQDEHNVLKTTESLQIETSTRRVMKELVQYYTKSLEKQKGHAAKIEDAGVENSDKLLR